MKATQTSRRPAHWKALTAIARLVQERHPEWVGTDLTDAVKTELVRQGYADPPTTRVYQALDAVDQARRRTRAAVRPSTPPSPAPRPLTPADARRMLRALCEHFDVGGAKAMASVQTR